MKRRSLLVLGGSALATGLAGCVGDGDDTADQSDDPTDGDDDVPVDDGNSTPVVDKLPDYAEELEECHLVRITYDSFPEEIQAEIDAALFEGAYEAELLLFDRAVDVEESFVVKDGTPYRPSVEEAGETKRLELTEVDTVRAPESYSISVENDDDAEYTLELELEGGGKTQLDKRVTVGPREEQAVETTADAFGSYTLTATFLEEEVTGSETVRIGDAYMDPFLVWISDGEVGITQVVAGLAPCPHSEFA